MPTTCNCRPFVVFTIVGVGWFQTAAGGYGGTKEKVIGFSVLAASILLFFVRRIVQDLNSDGRGKAECSDIPVRYLVAVAPA